VKNIDIMKYIGYWVAYNGGLQLFTKNTAICYYLYTSIDSELCPMLQTVRLTGIYYIKKFYMCPYIVGRSKTCKYILL